MNRPRLRSMLSIWILLSCPYESSKTALCAVHMNTVKLSMWILLSCPYESSKTALCAVHMNTVKLSIWIAKDCIVCCPYEHCWAVHMNRSWLRSMLLCVQSVPFCALIFWNTVAAHCCHQLIKSWHCKKSEKWLFSELLLKANIFSYDNFIIGDLLHECFDAMFLNFLNSSFFTLSFIFYILTYFLYLQIFSTLSFWSKLFSSMEHCWQYAASVCQSLYISWNYVSRFSHSLSTSFGQKIWV